MLLYYRPMGYFRSMKVKTSITLSPQTLRAIDDIADSSTSRSQIVEQAVIEFIERHRRQHREARDLEILNGSAAVLNREVEDILLYQIEP